MLLFALGASLKGQTPDTSSLHELAELLAQRAQSIDRLSYDYVQLSDGDVPDAMVTACAVEAATTNELGANFKFEYPKGNTKGALHGELLTFYSTSDQTYTQLDLGKEGYQPIFGSELGEAVGWTPFAPDIYHRLLLEQEMTSYAIDSTEYSIRVTAAYADNEYIRDSRKTIVFNRENGLFQSSRSTYSDGIKDRFKEIHYREPMINAAFEELATVPYLPDGSGFTLRAPDTTQTQELGSGDTLPNFREITTTLGLQDESIQLYLVDLWYFSCAPCQKLSPLIEQLNQQRPPGLAVFGLNLFDSDNTIHKYQELKGITFPSYSGKEYRDLYAVNSFPTVFLVDRQGKILEVIKGYDPDFSEQISPLIQHHLDGKSR